jgi:type I restriction enzyme R subunit
VDECHRTQSGKLHEAMKEILPGAVFIGFTGTPLLKADKQKSIEIFGGYIHTYKFDEAVKDGVVLDLRYEAREIDQSITSQKKIDEWFELKDQGPDRSSQGATQAALGHDAEGAVQPVTVGKHRRRHHDGYGNPCDRLASGRGNAMLVSGSIYEACKFFELFSTRPTCTASAPS